MIESIPFQTRARTLDHLGREQIADSPTAISELWKNSFDAYARSVQLDIFDGKEPVAAIVDDGHGMNRREFVERWLVVGTASKATGEVTDLADRDGLHFRQKQGQKGIGRLSCANLGPLLLLVSKRMASDYIAALLDWRIFENPFLNLADVHIPVTEFADRDDLFGRLDGLFEQLMDNVWGGGDPERALRIKAAWSDYDALKGAADVSGGDDAPSLLIANTLINAAFEERHIAQWPVWKGEAQHGTALLISQITYDLRANLPGLPQDQTAQRAREKFFQTLSNFVDPFVDPDGLTVSAKDPEFTYVVRTWEGHHSRTVVGVGKEFNRGMLDPLEHIVEATIDANGVFRGRIKAFGQWQSEDFAIEPPKDLIIPKRADTRLGPFDLYIASMEFESANSSLTKEQHAAFSELAKRYAGFMMFRDGLRIMPYGRSDNDFFEIDLRRSKSAGREFWNHRQMFGRLGISRDRNPNLKDKAGREGLLDNTAAKTLKLLIENILMRLAREFFGSSSDYRKDLLPDIQETNKKQRAADERNKLRKKQRSRFSSRLKQFGKEIPEFLAAVSMTADTLELSTERDIESAQSALGELKDRRAAFRLGDAPQSLGTLEPAYRTFREDIRSAQASIASIEDRIQGALERMAPAKPRAFAEKQLARNSALVSRRITNWKKTIEALQRDEYERLRVLIDERNKAFHSQVAPMLDLIDRKQIELSEAVRTMEAVRERLDAENANLFEPYISALESLKESIDLEHLANFGMEEVNELRQELDRLNALAQLGISVEIIGHELEAYDDMIRGGLSRLSDDVRSSSAAKDIEFGCEGLTEQLRFLSPLKLSGHRASSWITGAQIFEYVRDFFGPKFVRSHTLFEATPEFLAFKVYDQPARLYPVFINLVNNSLYWVGIQETKKAIRLSAASKRVVVSDSGPGVNEEDVDSLFSLFFTRKLRGGRGVGLYLCRANLAAGGHKISYLRDAETGLSGANFAIDFRGAEYA